MIFNFSLVIVIVIVVVVRVDVVDDITSNCGCHHATRHESPQIEAWTGQSSLYPSLPPYDCPHSGALGISYLLLEMMWMELGKL